MVLDRDEILNIIKEIKFDQYLENNRETILMSRYPLQ